MLKIQKSREFCQAVLDIVITQQITYIEGVLQICEEWEILPESVGNLIDAPIKERLEAEFGDIHMLRQKPSLEKLFVK